MSSSTAGINPTTVDTYSSTNAGAYEDPHNKNRVYGALSRSFVENIELLESDRLILDIGCGTGFVFDFLREKIEGLGAKCFGIDPAPGMLEVARTKFPANEAVSFAVGSFEEIPLEDSSVDRIISTLALHWAPAVGPAIEEMQRVLTPNGCIDILMIEKQDGTKFKASVVEAMRKHMSFGQIMKAAALALRLKPEELKREFARRFTNGWEVQVENPRMVINDSFENHMKWWRSRSTQIIEGVDDTELFFDDLRESLESISTDEGIPFDLSCLTLHLERIDGQT